MILLDFSPLLISCAHGAHKVFTKSKDQDSEYSNYIPDTTFKTFREIHMFRMLNTIRMSRKAHRAKYGHMVIAVDTKPYWRSKVFPLYKKNRRQMNPDIDWKTAFANGEEILAEAEKIFGYKVIRGEAIEADDIIGVLADHYDEPHMIVSPDGDFKQLQRLPNVRQVDAIRNKVVKCKLPERYLREKIIKGDAKDGIPNIKSQTDIFMIEGKNQTSISNDELKAWRDIEDPKMFCSTREMLERYEFNESLIDLTMVPKEYKQKILEMYEAPMPVRRSGPFNWFAKNGYTRFIDQVGDFT